MKKILSLILAITILMTTFMSTTAFAVSDSVGARETKIYIEAPKEWGTIKNIYCLIGNVYGGEELPFLELRTDSTKCNLVDANNRLYSFDTSVYCQKNDKNGYAIEDNADYYIVFSAINTKGDEFNTFKSTMGSPCLGDTAKIKYEKTGSGDSLRINNIIEWKNNSDKYGRQAVITPTGEIAGSYFPVALPIEEFVADWLGDWAEMNKYVITTETVKNICNVAGAEPQKVYNAYSKMFADKLADIKNNPNIAPLERIGVLLEIENTFYFVAGSKELCYKEWCEDPSITPYNVMVKDGDVYKITFYYVEPNEELQFKIAEFNYDENPNWYGCADGESVRFKVTSQCHVTVTFNPNNHFINVLGDGVEFTPDFEINNISVAGNGTGNWLNGAEWKLEDNSNVMTEIEENLYKITYEDVEAGENYQFKFAVDGSWSNHWGGTFEGFGTETDAFYGLDDNIEFSLTEKSDVIITLDLRKFNFITRQGAKLRVSLGKLSDVNDDGTISIIDATDIMKYSAELINETQLNLKYADVNGDGIVNVMDATAIQKVLAGI